jgi:hypothetical protein
MKRLCLSFAVLSSLLLSLVLFEPVEADASQAQWSSISVGWLRPTGRSSGVTKLQQKIEVSSLGSASYIAFTWMFTSGIGGYVGVQTDPSTPDGSVPPPIGFNYAIWDSTISSGDHCGSFDGEGVGHRCTNPAPYVPGAEYVFTIERLNFSNSRSTWKWRASVEIVSSSEIVVIGDIDSPSSAIQINSVGNFEEYFGQMPTSCESIPMTKARFFPPQEIVGNSNYEFIFNRDLSVMRGPDRCSEVGGANATISKISSFVDISLGGTRRSAYGHQVIASDGRCITGIAGESLATIPTLETCATGSKDQSWYLSAPFGAASGYMIGTIEIDGQCLTWVATPSPVVKLELCSDSIIPRTSWAQAEDGTIRPSSPQNTLCLSSASPISQLTLVNCSGIQNQQWREFATYIPTGFESVDPVRLFDTRRGSPQGLRTVTKTKIGADEVLKIQVTGVAGIPTSGVSAVSLNVTATGPTSEGYVTVYPCGQVPTASNLNFVSGQTIPNAVLVPISQFGQICFYSSSQTDLIADINGWFPTSSGFESVDPVRLFDTRRGSPQGLRTVTKTKIGADEVLKIQVTGVAGIPTSGVSAVSLNVTATGPTSEGFITVYPCGQVPTASNLNFVSGQTIPNAVLVPISQFGQICFYSSGETDLIADINGWFPTSSGFESVDPVRLFDTRRGSPQGLRTVYQSKIGADEVLELQVTGVAGIPTSGVSAVSLNVTATGPTSEGFITVYPCGQVPTASNLNFVSGQTIPNAVLVPINQFGQICFYSSGETDLIADINGWFPT